MDARHIVLDGRFNPTTARGRKNGEKYGNSGFNAAFAKLLLSQW